MLENVGCFDDTSGGKNIEQRKVFFLYNVGAFHFV